MQCENESLLSQRMAVDLKQHDVASSSERVLTSSTFLRSDIQ